MATTVTVSLKSELWASALAMRIDDDNRFDAKTLHDVPSGMLARELIGVEVALVGLSWFKLFESMAPARGTVVGLVFEYDVEEAIELYIEDNSRCFIEIDSMDTMEMLAAMLALYKGSQQVIPRIFADQVFATRNQRHYGAQVGLTVVESEIMALIAKGLSNQSIASIRFIALRTVEHHIHSIFDKFGLNELPESSLNRRVKAVIMWLRGGDPRTGLDARNGLDAELYVVTAQDAATVASDPNGKAAVR